MNTTFYYLVYQGGIANIFKTLDKSQAYKVSRIKQGDFRSCEQFCRGLKEAGADVTPAWCNQAGDITHSEWQFENFQDAPFNYSFASDFVNKE
jgi:hypothetical protein